MRGGGGHGMLWGRMREKGKGGAFRRVLSGFPVVSGKGGVGLSVEESTGESGLGTPLVRAAR